MAAIGSAALHTGRQSRQVDGVAEMLAEPADMFDGNEDSIALGIIQLKVLGCGSVVGFDHPSPSVPADAMRRVDEQFPRLEWRHELGRHLL